MIIRDFGHKIFKEENIFRKRWIFFQDEVEFWESKLTHELREDQRPKMLSLAVPLIAPLIFLIVIYDIFEEGYKCLKMKQNSFLC